MLGILTSIYLPVVVFVIALILSIMLVVFIKRGWHKYGHTAYCVLLLIVCNIMLYVLSFVVFVLGQFALQMLMAYLTCAMNSGGSGFPI